MIGRLTKEYDFHPYSVMIWPLPPFLHTSQSRGHVDVIRLSFHTFYGRIHHGAGRPCPTLRTLRNPINSRLLVGWTHPPHTPWQAGHGHLPGRWYPPLRLLSPPPPAKNTLDHLIMRKNRALLEKHGNFSVITMPMPTGCPLVGGGRRGRQVGLCWRAVRGRMVPPRAWWL